MSPLERVRAPRPFAGTHLNPVKTYRLVPCFAAGAFALGLAVSASAQSVPAPAPAPASAANAEETVTLPQFTVSSEKADTYRAADTMSLARIRGALIDTPLTVNVMTRELFDDLGANSTF